MFKLSDDWTRHIDHMDVHIYSSGKCVSSQLAKHTKAVTAAINAFVLATVVQQFTIAPETVCRIKYSRAVLPVSKHWQTASVLCTVCTEKPAAVTTRVPGDVHTLLVLVLHINNFSHLATAKNFSHLLAVVIQEGSFVSPPITIARVNCRRGEQTPSASLVILNEVSWVLISQLLLVVVPSAHSAITRSSVSSNHSELACAASTISNASSKST